MYSIPDRAAEYSGLRGKAANVGFDVGVRLHSRPTLRAAGAADACDQIMAVAKADASSSVRPRSLDMIANQAASAEPVHDDITGSCIKSFEHRHLADDTGRQVGELRKLCRRRPNGFFLHELAPLAQLLTLMAARLERLGGESGDLGPAAAAMVLLCTRPFQMKLASDEARFTADATPLFEALALFLSTPAPRHAGGGGPASKDPVRRTGRSTAG